MRTRSGFSRRGWTSRGRSPQRSRRGQRGPHTGRVHEHDVTVNRLRGGDTAFESRRHHECPAGTGADEPVAETRWRDRDPGATDVRAVQQVQRQFIHEQVAPRRGDDETDIRRQQRDIRAVGGGSERQRRSGQVRGRRQHVSRRDTGDCRGPIAACTRQQRDRSNRDHGFRSAGREMVCHNGASLISRLACGYANPAGRN